jgi:pimeloyl-ACP methyl ester carboxylesterase
MALTAPRPAHRSRLRPLVALGTVLLIAAVSAHSASAQSSAHSHTAKPTVVLVHGAWADASSWAGVVAGLQRDGYTVAAIPNPLRSLSGDSAYVAAHLDAINGPMVLVGHSYGGAVITNAATGHANVKALIYVDAFVPDEGQTVAPLAGPDSALAVADPTTVFDFVPATLPPMPTTDVYLKTSVFLSALANGLRQDQASVLAASQRPITLAALNEPSGAAAWKTIRSWYLVGTKDRVIPPSAQLAMAQQAGATITNFEAGHLGLISEPKAVVHVIEQAARATGD